MLLRVVLRWLEQEDQRRGKEAVQNLMIQHNPFPLPDRNMYARIHQFRILCASV